MHPFSRRLFVQATAMGSLGFPTLAQPSPEIPTSKPPSSHRNPVAFSQDRNRIRILTPGLARPFNLLMLADTHLFRDDDRGEPFRSFSGRMAKAYNQTRHFESGEPTDPEKGFTEALRAAQKNQSALVALVGDIVSFPSEAAVEWVLAQLRESGLPSLYTAGNHDWHYEGMEGPLDSLRDTWIQKRLLPLYRGDSPLMSVREVEGVRVVAIDNSTYEILPAQLDFLRQQIASNNPFVLCVHIPLHAPGRSLGFGCGHPDWSADTDRNHQLERRVRWREGGHTRVTFDFHREVFAAPNLLAIFAGHTHRASLDVINGIPQFVTDPNATGAHLFVDFIPA